MPLATLVQDVRVNQRGADIFVTERFLHSGYFQPPARKWVAKLCRKVWLVTRYRKPDRRPTSERAAWDSRDERMTS